MTDACRDAAVLAIRQARQRHDLLDTLFLDRKPGDVQSARLGLILQVISPVIVALEAIIAEGDTK